MAADSVTIIIDGESSRAVSATPSGPALPTAFSRMMSNTWPQNSIQRDTCSRPPPVYNKNYNPYQAPSIELSASYSPYAFGEPLFDDRAAVVARFPKKHSLAAAPKRARQNWSWRLGYALIDNSKSKPPTIWSCKLCHHDVEFSRGKEWHFNANTMRNAEKHLSEVHFLDEFGDIWRAQLEPIAAQASGIVEGEYKRVIPFRQLEFKNALLEWLICDSISHRKASSPRLRRLFKIANSDASKALPKSHSTCSNWVHELFEYFEPQIIEEIRTARSNISISFDGWGSKREKISVVGVVVHFINNRYENVTRLIGLPSLPSHRKSGVDQCAVILPLLQRFGITSKNLGYFVLDNASNNDTTLKALAEAMGFDAVTKRLRCMGHIINLIAEAYLFGQDCISFEEDFKKAGAPARRELWRQRGELGKLHNIVAHVMASGKRSDLFRDLQPDHNIGVAKEKIWQLVLDGGIRWNATYSMIRRALELRQAIDAYAFKLKMSKDAFDIETFTNDYLTDTEWDTLQLIKDQLEPLFRFTKDLEGNSKLKEGASKASHGALWEVLPVIEIILNHFEALEARAKAGAFSNHQGIQNSITLAWNAAQKWYKKTDSSIAWVGAVVLHPRWKWSYFEEMWVGSARSYIAPAKRKLRVLWERDYKATASAANRVASPEIEQSELSYLEQHLNRMAPTTALHVPRASSRRDELVLYMEEPPIGYIGVMEYWRSREEQWPQLAKMAYDFLSVPAMSAECERVFSSCAKLTTPQSSSLSVDMLWHQECLSNWQRRGAIQMSTAWNAIQLDLGE